MPETGARGILEAALAQWGLQSLATWAWDLRNQGMPMEQLFGIELRKRPEYKQRFPAMQALADKGHAISEAAYIGWEQQVTALYRQWGFPEGFYDSPEDFKKDLIGEVSVAEKATRIEMAATAEFIAPVEDKAELERLFGVSPGERLAYFIDPNRALPLIQKRWMGAQLSGTAMRTGYGQLAQTEAERLAELGVDQAAAQQSFTELAARKELFASLDQGEQEISRETQIGAAFEGEASDLTEIEKRQRRRVAAYEAGGSVVGTERGFAGAGSARSGGR